MFITQTLVMLLARIVLSNTAISLRKSCVSCIHVKQWPATGEKFSMVPHTLPSTHPNKKSPVCKYQRSRINSRKVVQMCGFVARTG